jgi:molecular chaperone DnaJ
VKIKIPAGIDTESRLRSTGGGEAGVRGGPAGDLYVVVHIREHDVFTRNGIDLACEVPIPFSTAALGGEIKVPTLDGSVSLKIPPGTQGGSVFRIRGFGMPALQGIGKGDILTQVQVEVPTRLNSEQRAALQAFAELCGEENNPIHKSFYDRVKSFFA